MTAPSEFPTVTNRVRLGLLLFVALPCLPGLIFLLSGLLIDPHWWSHDPSVTAQARYALAWERTRELYLAGGFVLLAGTACAGGVVWKIARPGQPSEDEETERETSTDHEQS